MTKQEEWVKLWQLDQLDNLELLSALIVHQAFPRHSHPTYSIAFIEEGVEILQFGSQTVYAPPGSLVLIHPGEVHANQAGQEQGWRYRNLYVTADHLLYACKNMGLPSNQPPYFSHKVIHDPVLFGRFDQMHQRLEVQGLTPANEQLFFETLGELVVRYTGAESVLASPPFSRSLLEVVETINRQPAQRLTIEQLARQAGLSRFHFMRRFSQLTGLSPAAYVIQKRIELAKTLLRQDMPIAEVALETGFFDQSHFSRYFKRLTGTTPGDLH